ncbi:WXG100 family type VII secretion target [Actinomadura rudentiformis]|uniref:ESAT-6-like protein n=1 Tax=Actinomadura rudentiformis TaxID=359158 RepID=A0A6H9Z3A0_9ACTN|nr:WXG100 family type VII secretion target [Actinomadura rudentiformis]KAB2347830.1 WXG100 family type VII secretion target [Actinomadura rudentiformis]
MAQSSSVDRAEMAQAAQRVESAAQDFHKMRGDLSSEQQQLQAKWIGEASTAFTKVYNEFDGELGKVIQALETLHEKMTQAKINYEASEQQQTESVNQLNSLLNL